MFILWANQTARTSFSFIFVTNIIAIHFWFNTFYLIMHGWFLSEIVLLYKLLPTHLYISILLKSLLHILVFWVFCVCLFFVVFFVVFFFAKSLNISFYFSVLKNGLKVLVVPCGTVRNMSGTENKIWWVCYLLNYCHKAWSFT